jgi:hypothetical protein
LSQAILSLEFLSRDIMSGATFEKRNFVGDIMSRDIFAVILCRRTKERDRPVRANQTINLVEEMAIEATESGDVMYIQRVAREFGTSTRTANLILKKTCNFIRTTP